MWLSELFDQAFEVAEHCRPGLLRTRAFLVAARVVLCHGHLGAAVVPGRGEAEGHRVRVVRGAPVRVGEQPVRYHLDDLALIAEGFTLPLSAERDRAALAPVRLDV